ncbi:hypothetical protein AX774_g1947 [Zancudomyces culisetae]|uniref:Uncharacterized protein n=1 Tax=Zancudomyces culisetae TaxID=1213189 RepID=A0A1R1PUG1_ZANCU|nr:hypothetical protein AX774_g1947 [Zancudomyces culisetae]|eukprot:OMH84542.1 hypothetical protein AX774_g1947 [Zancudomyces culisetae]
MFQENSHKLPELCKNEFLMTLSDLESVRDLFFTILGLIRMIVPRQDNSTAPSPAPVTTAASTPVVENYQAHSTTLGTSETAIPSTSAAPAKRSLPLTPEDIDSGDKKPAKIAKSKAKPKPKSKKAKKEEVLEPEVVAAAPSSSSGESSEDDIPLSKMNLVFNPDASPSKSKSRPASNASPSADQSSIAAIQSANPLASATLQSIPDAASLATPIAISSTPITATTTTASTTSRSSADALAFFRNSIASCKAKLSDPSLSATVNPTFGSEFAYDFGFGVGLGFGFGYTDPNSFVDSKDPNAFASLDSSTSATLQSIPDAASLATPIAISSTPITATTTTASTTSRSSADALAFFRNSIASCKAKLSDPSLSATVNPTFGSEFAYDFGFGVGLGFGFGYTDPNSFVDSKDPNAFASLDSSSIDNLTINNLLTF